MGRVINRNDDGQSNTTRKDEKAFEKCQTYPVTPLEPSCCLAAGPSVRELLITWTTNVVARKRFVTRDNNFLAH
jgi:hypothetical protein